jgi:hypothetical protein
LNRNFQHSGYLYGLPIQVPADDSKQQRCKKTAWKPPNSVFALQPERPILPMVFSKAVPPAISPAYWHPWEPWQNTVGDSNSMRKSQEDRIFFSGEFRRVARP